MTHFYVSGGKTPDHGSRTYTEIMREQFLKGEESEVSFFFLNFKFFYLFNYLFFFSYVKKLLKNQKMELSIKTVVTVMDQKENREKEEDGIKQLMINLFQLKKLLEVQHHLGRMM